MRLLVATRVAKPVQVGWMTENKGLVLGCALGWGCLVLTSGCQVNPPSRTVAPAPALPWKTPPELVLNANSMRAELKFFSSDQMAGRYTLAKEIDSAASWLVQQYRTARIPSAVGQDYQHRYKVHLGPTQDAPPSLSFVSDDFRPREVASRSVASVSLGQGGLGQGQVVFVGYGIEQRGEGATLKEISGLKLKGKVALVLDGTPGELYLEDIEQRAQDIAELYDSKLQAQPNPSQQRRTKLLSSARSSFFKVLCTYVPRQSLPADYLKKDLKAGGSITSQDLLDPLWDALREEKRKRQRIEPVALETKLKDLQAAGAVAAIVVKGPASFIDAQSRQRERLPRFEMSSQVSLDKVQSIPAVYLASEVASRWFARQGMSLERLQHSVDLSLRSHSVGIPGLSAKVQVHMSRPEQEAPNVLAVIPGSDLAKEIVVIGGHFDHIGTAENNAHCMSDEIEQAQDEICNGADDNASGTVAILEIARAIRRSGKKPRRTLVFAHFSGEELGLLGSKALVRDEVIDLSRIVALINIDMIGRLQGRELKVGGLGTSRAWEGLLDGIDHHGIDMLYDVSSTYRSDHASFVEKKIPSLFFFSGVHDLYHQPGDEVQTLDFPSYVGITKSIAQLVSTLAQGAPIEWSEPAPGKGLVADLPGDNPAFVLKRVKANQRVKGPKNPRSLQPKGPAQAGL